MMNNPPQETPEPQLTVVDVIAAVFRDFRGFAARYLREPGPPSFFVVVWLMGMDGIAGALDYQTMTGAEAALDNWFYTWVQIMFVGVFTGVARYWIAGSVFHALVLAAGGSGPARTSRYIFVYAVLPVAVTHLIVKIVQMLVYRNGYFAGQTEPVLDGFFAGAMMLAFFFSIVLCFRGMTTLQNADPARSRVILAAVAVGMAALAIGIMS